MIKLIHRIGEKEVFIAMIDRSEYDRSEYAKWLTSEIGYETSYHNHKETMAWVITALYVPGSITLGYIASRWQVGWEVCIPILLLVVTYLVFCFVKMQFDMRWEAADVVHILMQQWARLNRGEEPPQDDEWKIDKADDHWPHFVQEQIDKSRQEKRNCKERCKALKKFHLWWRYKKNKKEVVDNRWKTELTSYSLIIIAMVFAICLAVWN